MAVKDGSIGFDFSEVTPVLLRKITQTFNPENENLVEMQKGAWQAILNSFKKYIIER